MKLTKRLNQKVKLILWLFGSFLVPWIGQTQSLALADCQKLARELSPLQRQEQYLAAINTLKQRTIQDALLPDISFQGKASYQSDVLELPINIPGSEIPSIPKDQHQLSLNLTQSIYDGGATKATQQLQIVEHQLEAALLEVSLYQLRTVINDLYFAILSFHENEQILKTMLKELESQIRRTNSAVTNGTLLPSELKSLQKEKLSTAQDINAIQIRKESLLIILSDWIGQEITAQTEFTLPKTIPIDYEIHRPELTTYAYKMEQLNIRESLVSSQSRPKLSAFAHGGYASPNPYNVFATNWNTYYTLGGKLEWRFWNWNNTKKQQQILSLNQEVVRSEQEHFEKRLRNDLTRQSGEITLLKSSLRTDLELFKLQKDITASASARFTEGVISATDYLTELHALTQAELQYELHQVKLVKSEIEFQTLSGNMP